MKKIFVLETLSAVFCILTIIAAILALYDTGHPIWNKYLLISYFSIVIAIILSKIATVYSKKAKRF